MLVLVVMTMSYEQDRRPLVAVTPSCSLSPPGPQHRMRPRSMSAERRHPHALMAIKLTLLVMLAAAAIAIMVILVALRSEFSAWSKAAQINALRRAISARPDGDNNDKDIELRTYDLEQDMLLVAIVLLEVLIAGYAVLVVRQWRNAITICAFVLMPVVLLLSLLMAADAVPTAVVIVDVYLMLLMAFSFLYAAKLPK